MTGELGSRQFRHAQAPQQGHQRKGLGGGLQLAACAEQILFVQEPFDDGGASGRGTQAFLAHGRPEFLVVDQFTGAFHDGQEGGFGEPRRRFGLQTADLDRVGVDLFARGYGRETRAFGVLGFLAVDSQPPGVEHDLALGLERLVFDPGDAGGNEKLRGGMEHGQKPFYDEVVEFVFDLGEVFGRLDGGDDGEMVGNLGVIEDAFAGADPVFRQNPLGKGLVRSLLAERTEGLAHGFLVILGQCAAIRPRVGDRLVPLIQRLGQLQSALRRKPEPPVGIALQARQIIEQRRRLRGRFGFLGDRPRLALALLPEAFGAGGVPEPFRPSLGVPVLLAHEGLVEPAAAIHPGRGGEGRVDLPIVPGAERFDPFLALDHDGQGRGLDPADGGKMKTAGLRVEGRHGPGAVDAHQPVRFRAADRGGSQGLQRLVVAQGLKPLANGRRGHRLQPEPADRFLCAGVPDDVTEDELAFAPGVAGVDQAIDILAFDQPREQLQPALRLFDRFEVEMGRNDRQMGETPLAAFDLVGLGHLQLEQMSNGGRHHELVALKIVVMPIAAAERSRDIGGHRGFLGNDKSLGHRDAA